MKKAEGQKSRDRVPLKQNNCNYILAMDWLGSKPSDAPMEELLSPKPISADTKILVTSVNAQTSFVTTHYSNTLCYPEQFLVL
jgi:hypothetical protein